MTETSQPVITRRNRRALVRGLLDLIASRHSGELAEKAFQLWRHDRKNLLSELDVKPIYAVAVRDPEEAAASLARRHGFVKDKSRPLWLSHVLENERQTRGQSRLFLSYEALLSDWRRSLAPLVEVHGLPLSLNDATAAKNVSDFLEPTLRHHSGSSPSESRSFLANITTTLMHYLSTQWLLSTN